MAFTATLAKVREAPFLLDALGAADELVQAAAHDDGPYTVRVLAEAVAGHDDQVTAIAAVRALGAVADPEAAAILSDTLSDPRPFVREHSAWALGSRLQPELAAVGRLIGGIADGGFGTVIGQRALRRWSLTTPDPLALALEAALLWQDEPAARVRLVESLGAIPGSIAARTLLRVAADDAEHREVRSAAVAALGDRAGEGAAADLVVRLARRDGELQAVARLAAFDLGLPGRNLGLAGRPGHPAMDEPAPGLGVAQLFLHADLDLDLSRAGAGDTGGIATMLVRLGDALASQPAVGRVLTLSRGTEEAAVAGLGTVPDGHVLTPVPLPGSAVPAAEAWPLNIAAERGIRRALTAHGPIDVLHLRMADVGSMAASAVATRLGIPIVYTLAPDPHAVVHALDMTGALSRANFGTVDQAEHYWYRLSLVRRLATSAQHAVLFPRPELRQDLHELLGIDIDAEPARYTVVPEGIDLTVADAAARTERVRAGRTAPEPDDLDRVLAALPPHRRGLPLAVSVGRLHRVKGMATVVEAWASDAALRARCNLLIVGGDLLHPSPDERGQLAAIAAVLEAHPDAREGLLLPGHRPNGTVARWLAAAAGGRPAPAGDPTPASDDLDAPAGEPAVAALPPGGVYVCGSLKEEFGLALLEALAAGLVVVGPDGGGPATYIEPGRTGFLVDTRSPAAVGAGIAAALDLAGVADGGARVRAVRAMLEDRFTVRAMAGTLARVYAGVRAPAHR